MDGGVPNMNFPYSRKNPSHLDVLCDDQVLLTLQYSTQWDALAQDCGYYDQSHLIREFQALAGHAPVEFLRHAALDDESISEANRRAD